MKPLSAIRVEIAPGELIDKIAILQIKCERIGDPDKKRNVAHELRILEQARDAAIEPSEAVAELTSQLRQVNKALWDVEDEIRMCERRQDFGPKFIELARSVYHTNDRRAMLKRQVNTLLGSPIVEEKAYADYSASP